MTNVSEKTDTDTELYPIFLPEGLGINIFNERNRLVRIITLTILLVLTASFAFTQTPIVTSASFLEWDNSNPPGAIDGTNIYLRNTPGIVPDGNPTSSVTGDVTQWPIVAASGTWYAVVTFRGTDYNGDAIETPPSNEITFIVISSPSGLRIVKP